MKKTTMMNIAAYISNVSELSNEYNELMAEINKNAEKAEANRQLYESAKANVLRVMDTTPKTVNDIYELCKDNLPDGFTKNKVQYALLHYWNDEVVKIDNGKNANTYNLR